MSHPTHLLHIDASVLGEHSVSRQVSAVQDVDMATTLSNLTATQTQLQASYRLISGASTLSLVSFLPAAA